MRAAEGWKDYELVDCGGRERLERWGSYLLVRPDPQAIWNTERRHPGWRDAHAVYHRSSSGGGSWEFRKKIPAEWKIAWRDVTLTVTPTNFKHTGVFPEQAANWALYQSVLRDAAATRGRDKPIKVLNLFGYTGAATVACLAAGASVCHVDASKGMVALAKQNVALSGLADASVRYIVDDCTKFVAREIRRGVRYDGLIMDPPSYGRGPSGEVWKLEDSIYDLVQLCAGVMVERPLFFALNSYTAGLAPSVSGYLVADALRDRPGRVHSDEIGLPVTQSGLVLPCGSTSIYLSDEVTL